MIFTRGMRDKLSKYVDIQQEITAEISIEGRSVYDFCCFGVDKAEKLSDDRYMIFYNQTSSPQGEIKYKAGYNSAAFTLRLDKLPETIDKLVFTASIDGSGVMGDITRLKFTVSQNGSERIVIDLKGSDFKQEKAVIAAGIYRKTEWRINAIASGFNGGLPVLLKNFGGEEAVSETTAPAPSVNAQTQTVPTPSVRTQTQTAPTPSVRTQTQTAPTPSVNTQAQTVSTPSVRTQAQTALTPSLNTQQTPPVSVVESLHRNLSFETVRADTAQSNIAPQNPIPQSIPTPPSQSILKLNITPPSQSTSHLNITPPSQNMPQLNITPPSNYMPQQNVISQPQNTPQQNMTAASRYMPQQNVISQPQNIPQQNMTAASRYMPQQNVISQPQYTPQNNTAMQTGNTAALHIGGFTATAMHMNTNPQPSFNTTSQTSFNTPPQPSFNTPVQSSGQGVVLRKTEEQLTSEIMGKINLSKDKVNLEKHVVNLSKCVVDLSKKSGVDLGSARAKVVVVLDYSGSMHTLYANGTVQRTINRLVPLGLTFDDNGTIDVFLFSTEYKKLDDLNIMNYESYVNFVAKNSGMNMGGTMYSPVLRAIILGDTVKKGLFFGKAEYTPPIVDNGEPTFVLFITDGENADNINTNEIIMRSSSMNVFIQFIGIGTEKFEYLRKLDDLPGRVRDNTGFSQMESLDGASDQELYTNVLGQFANWLRGLQ